MQIWELTIHWKSGLKTRGMFASEVIARESYKLSTKDIRHTELPPFKVEPMYVSSIPENIGTRIAG